MLGAAAAQTTPVITLQPASQTNFAGASASLGVGVSGTEPFFYQWRLNSNNLPNNIITTVAGGGIGDGGPATNATLLGPNAVAVDADGNVFIADSSNARVRKVAGNGTISTVAGFGSFGKSADRGAATNAGLGFVSGVAFDALGNLFLSDLGNNRIRKVDVRGAITTVAGDGSPGYQGDGGPATNASLRNPDCVAVDASGNLFIADTGNVRVRKVDTNGIITTVAGDGMSGFSGDYGPAANASLNNPAGVAVDALGDLFIADEGNGRVRKVDANGIITTVAGDYPFGPAGVGDGGPATNANVSPAAVAVDARGNLYIADLGNRIRKVDAKGVITTVAGGAYSDPFTGGPFFSGDGGAATNANLYFPSGVAVDASGALFIADSYNQRVRKVGTNGIITTFAGGGSIGDGRAATGAELTIPGGVAVDSAGDLFVVDQGNSRVREVTVDGIITTVAGNGPYGSLGDGGLATNAEIKPSAVAVDALGDLFITDSGSIRKVDGAGMISRFAGNGSAIYSGDGGAATNAGVDPAGAAVDAEGNLFIPDWGNHRIRRVNAKGIISTVAGNGTSGFTGDGGAATNASLSHPVGVAVDRLGDLFIADSGNNRIRKVDAKGIISTAAGNGEAFSFGDGGASTNAGLIADAVAVDPFGNIFILDQERGQVREVDSRGLISTVAGNGDFGFSGDGGAATNAALNFPQAVAVDALGNLFIADANNQRVREVALAGSATLYLENISTATAGNYDVIVTNLYGSATSAVASVTVALPTLGASLGAGGLALRFNGAPGLKCLLEETSSLNPPVVWFPVATNAADGSGLWLFVQTNVPSLQAQFYRLTLPASVAVGGVAPAITLQPLSQSIAAGSNATLNVQVSGSGPFTYQWQFNGTNLPNNIITTVAGQSLGDGGPATNASLYELGGVAVDAAGNLFVVDTFNSRVREVDTNGVIFTVAGNRGGYGTNSGVGGPATNAHLSSPSNVAVDAAGNLFIAETESGLVLKVDGGGVMTIVAGNGRVGYSGDGGAATQAELNSPTGLATDGSGNLFIVDQANYRVRKVDTNGVITLVAGNGTPGYKGDGGRATAAEISPSTVAVDAAGNIYLADEYNNVVRKVDAAGIIGTAAGNGHAGFSGDGGLAAGAELDNPAGVAVDSAGDLFVVDNANYRVREVSVDGVITTVAGNGTNGFSGDGGAATKASLDYPGYLAADKFGNLFIVDGGNSRVRKVDTNGVITTIAGDGTGPRCCNGVAATSANLFHPSGVAMDASGNLFIADTDNNLVRQVDTNGIITVVAGILVNPYGYWSCDGGAATNAALNSPSGVAKDAAGNLFIADAGNDRVRKVDANGIITTVAGGFYPSPLGDYGAATNAGLRYPAAVAVDISGNLFIADSQDNRVRKVDLNGIITTAAGDGAFGYSDGTSLAYPTGVAVDMAGNLFIADEGNNRVRFVDEYTGMLTLAGNGTSGYAGDGGPATDAGLVPSAVAVDANGNVYIADLNSVVRRLDVNGTITTVAGNGMPGYSGDGGAATNASLSIPSGVAVDLSGNLFIADSGNNRVLKVALGGSPTLRLENLSAANAGDYRVIVTGPYGSVTSSVATVAIGAPAPGKGPSR
jgi:sugar lactone lactonase YvrE